MSHRVDLLNRADSSSTSPFLWCNIVARRARQIATARSVSVSPDLINLVFVEYLEGAIKYEVGAPAPDRACPDVKVGRKTDQRHPVAAAITPASQRVLQPLMSG